MPSFVFINHLQAKDGQQEQLIDLMREFAPSILAEPGNQHYSVHRPIDDEGGPLTVIQAYSSVEAFEAHGAWMAGNVPRLVPLLASPPQPPVLLEDIALGSTTQGSFNR